MAAELNKPYNVFKQIKNIKRNIKEFALLSVMYAFMIDYAGINP